MLANMIAPEVALGKAWSDLETAKLELGQLQAFADNDGVPWSLTHSLFANIGGFVIRISTEKTRGRPALIGNGTQKDSEIPVVESKIDSKSAQIKEATLAPSYSNPFHLTASDICRLRDAGLLASLPYVTLGEINDKSKSDSFARAITIFQIAWTGVQVIARAVRHLPISQLEITVVAFSVCAIVTYGLNWEKPKGVEVPYTLLQYQREIPKEVLKVLKGRPKYRPYFFTSLAEEFGKVLPVKKFFSTLFGSSQRNRLMGSPISNDDTRDDGSGDVLGILIGTVLFGALHIAAWNFIFPTRAEQIIWWITSLFCTTLILIFIPIVLLVERFTPDLDDFVFALLSILYVLARLFLMVEIFRTLCFLPPDAYVATWASNIPHIA